MRPIGHLFVTLPIATIVCAAVVATVVPACFDLSDCSGDHSVDQYICVHSTGGAWNSKSCQCSEPQASGLPGFGDSCSVDVGCRRGYVCEDRTCGSGRSDAATDARAVADAATEASDAGAD